MRITPLDIRNHDFRRRLKGYDGEEVDEFLRMIAEDYEGVLRELASLQDDKGQLEVRVAELSGREAILQETLTTAQQMSEDLKRTALKESEVRIGEAEIKAEKILDAAHRRAARLAEDIREMKSLRSRLSAAVRAAIETHLGLLEGLAEGDSEDPVIEGKVAYLTRAPGTTRTQGGS
jgi:cell division initiation protein